MGTVEGAMMRGFGSGGFFVTGLPFPPLLPGVFDLPGQLRGIAVLRGIRAGVGRFSHVNRV